MDQADAERLAELFGHAITLPEADRRRYAAEVCRDDPDVCAELVSLLSAYEHAPDDYLEHLAQALRLGDPLDLEPGTLLGPYRIESLIGAGGMGRVYSATDIRLGRSVAVKVLSTTLADNAHFHARFYREAQTIASLTHPNICILHDIGQHAGLDFLVMERLEGPTLATRLESGSLPLGQALAIAIEIADALTAAHRLRIVHRDLKPANIMLTRTGSKLLDFGLAKAAAPRLGATTPTEVSSLTTEGAIVGTFQYMAPEQLEGNEADPRTDIFALGAVLYEMLTGKKTFEGQSHASLIAAILHSEPAAVSASQPLAPPALDRIVSRCLAKTPDNRWQDARDLVLELQWIADARSALVPPVPGRPDERLSSRVGSPPRALLVLALCAVTGILAFLIGLRQTTLLSPHVTRLTFDRGTVREARFTPDGKTVLYGAAWRGEPIRIFQTRIGSIESSTLQVPDAEVLAVSSTGELAISIGHRFRSWIGEGTLARAPLVGGTFRELAEHVRAADWSPDGAELAIVRRVNGRDRLEYPIGNALHETTGYISHLRVSPSGDAVAYHDHQVFGDNRGRISIVTRRGERRHLTQEWAAEDGLAWSRDGREVWFAASDAGRNVLFAVTLDGRLRRTWAAPADLTILDIGPEGQVLATANTIRTDINWWGTARDEERDISWYAWSYAKDVTPDGRMILLTRFGEESGHDYKIGIRRIDTPTAVLLGNGTGSLFSPDARWVIGMTQSEPSLFLLPTGAGERRTLTAAGFSYITAGWFPDGRRVIFAARHNDSAPSAYLQDIDGSAPVRLPQPIPQLRSDWAIRVSPDGSKFFGAQTSGPPVIIPTGAGGQPRVLHEVSAEDLPVSWTADGRGILLVRQSTDPMTAVIARFDLASGVIENLRETRIADRSGGRSLSCIATPTAANVVCNVGRYLTDLYLVEHLK
ncbi:Serine/threonine-protein kinase PrkC [Luteitalea pratensis]|uniref:non-specific serine/threonine protein kinase n=1 Tax=Luteitalea pratensis TaxID=1855912 RepID=A0A143PMX3_LUTPR|nr:protein kinase [Luteitalea pratensis]AMY09510.1 Serine/threonine-protein kinase PrkC [Luteitalea pratensis]